MTDLTLVETKDLLVELQRRFQAAVFLCRMLDEFVMDELRQAKRELRPWEGI